MLFTLLPDRYERGSVMITSNLFFSKWEQIFKDPMVTAAAIDRLVQHSVILKLNIEIYRMHVATKNKSKKPDARKKALSEWILGNANLWAGNRSLNVGHLGKPFFRQINERRKNMQQTVYNPQKGRLETINIEFTDENTTWFDECEDSHGIFSITDLQGGILIKEADYTYPLYVYDISRADIGHDHSKARALHRQVTAMVIGQKRHPGETPVTLRVLCVSPGIKNEKIGVGFAKDVHADSGNNLAHRQANAVSLLHSICLPVAVSTFVVKIGNFNCR